MSLPENLILIGQLFHLWKKKCLILMCYFDMGVVLIPHSDVNNTISMFGVENILYESKGET